MLDSGIETDSKFPFFLKTLHIKWIVQMQMWQGTTCDHPCEYQGVIFIDWPLVTSSLSTHFFWHLLSNPAVNLYAGIFEIIKMSYSASSEDLILTLLLSLLIRVAFVPIRREVPVFDVWSRTNRRLAFPSARRAIPHDNRRLRVPVLIMVLSMESKLMP